MVGSIDAPLGALAIAHEVNGINVCDCGFHGFHGLLKIEPDGRQNLVVLKCARCAKETPVPPDIMGKNVRLDG